MKTNQRIGLGTAVFVGLLFLVTAAPSSAPDLLTKTERITNTYGSHLFLQYTYSLDVEGREALHGERIQYYYPPAALVDEVSVLERYSHGKKHGLVEVIYILQKMTELRN